MNEILVKGVSTRKYRRVLPAMAGSAGISKSSVSRKFRAASEEALKQLMERPYTEQDILGVYNVDMAYCCQEASVSLLLS